MKKIVHLLWIGPLISLFGIVSYFLFFVRFPILRDTALLNLFLVTVGAGLSLGGLVAVWRAGRPVWMRALGALGLAASLFPASMLYHYVFVKTNTLPEPDRLTLTIASVPKITLLDQHGKPVPLQVKQDRKLVLSFYRGHW